MNQSELTPKKKPAINWLVWSGVICCCLAALSNVVAFIATFIAMQVTFRSLDNSPPPPISPNIQRMLDGMAILGFVQLGLSGIGVLLLAFGGIAYISRRKTTV